MNRSAAAPVKNVERSFGAAAKSPFVTGREDGIYLVTRGVPGGRARKRDNARRVVGGRVVTERGRGGRIAVGQ
ncbi:Hypothetical protein NTJ_08566 [Nesidiocoris tenuis]|uniref:Uncharacterized protein n=1 Tax=Nesidiocoris tenuis TaxID=355587 RepID=A0ABN7AU72_9HEMI|nr:Hypothetical protein NTJ_08566 [Nesidiocoris tenuis]